MDRDQLIELIPHYVAMLLLVFGTLAIVRSFTGELSFWAELIIVLIVVVAYRPIVKQLDVEPSAWKNQR